MHPRFPIQNVRLRVLHNACTLGPAAVQRRTRCASDIISEHLGMVNSLPYLLLMQDAHCARVSALLAAQVSICQPGMLLLSIPASLEQALPLLRQVSVLRRYTATDRKCNLPPTQSEVLSTLCYISPPGFSVCL